MASKPAKLLLAILCAVFLICGAAALGLFPVNLFFLKEPLAEAVREQLGMDLDVGGPLRLWLGFSPELQASEIKLRLSDSNTELLHIDSLSLGPAIRDLWRGQVHLRHLEAAGILLDYCPDSLPALQAAGRDDDSPPESVELKSVQLQGLELICNDPEQRLEFIPGVLSIRATAARGEPLGLEIESLASNDFFLSASGDSLATLLDDTANFAFRFSADIFTARLGLESTLVRTESNWRLEGFFELETEEINALAAPFGAQLETLGPGRLSTRFLASSGLLEFDGLAADALGMTVTGRGSAGPGDDQPRLDLDLNLDQLDGEALISRFAPGETREEKPPDVDLDSLLTHLAAVDGSARVMIGRITGAPLAAENLELAAELENGVLQLTASTPALEGSPAAAAVSVHAKEDCPTLSTRLDMAEADLATLGLVFEPLRPLGGRVEAFRLGTDSCGKRLTEHLETLSIQGSLRGFGVSWEDQPVPLRLDAVDLETGWRTPGKLTVQGTLLNHPVGSEFTFGSLQTAWSGETWPLRVALSGPQSALSFGGTTRLKTPAPELAGEIHWDVMRFGALHDWLGSDANNKLRFRGGAAVLLDEDLSLNISDMQLGRSQLSGEIEWPRPGSENGGRLYLESKRLDLGELSTLFSASKNESGVARTNLRDIFYDAELISRWLKLPRLDTELAIGEVHGTAFDIRDIAMKAAFSEGVASDGRLSARVDNIRVDGSVNADFRSQQGSVLLDFELLNVDVGGLLSTMELADDLDAHAERLDLRVEASGRSLAELISEADVNVGIDALAWRFEAGPDMLQQELLLDRLMLTTSRGDPLQWDAAGSLNDFPIRAWMSTPSLKALFDDRQDLPLKFVMGISDEVVMVDGILGRPTPQGRQVSLTLSGARMEYTDADFAGFASPLTDYSLLGDFTVLPEELSVRNLQVAIGGSRAHGTASLRYEKPLYLLEARLNSAALETDDLIVLAEDFRTSARILNAIENEEDVNLENRGGLTVLLGQQLESLVERLHFNIDLGVDELRSTGTSLGALELHGSLNREGLAIELETRHESSKISLDYRSLLRQGLAENRFDLDIERLDYGGLLRLFNPDATAYGELHADIELVSSTADPTQAVNQLEGHFDLAAFPENIEAAFLDLWASNLVLALLPTGKDSGKQMNCLVARFEVEDGVMKSRNTLLDTTDIIVRARGEIDLVNRELDLLIAPQAKTERFLSVSTPLEVSGPFDDFIVGIAPGGLLTTMIRWYYGLVYVPWKWLTGERFPADGIATCYRAMDWELPDRGHDPR